MFAGIYSVSGVQTVYHGCCRTQRNVTVWKPKQVRIWVSTENSRGPEIRPDGGRHGTSSFHAGFRLTEEEQGQREMMKMGRKQTLKVRRKIVKKKCFITLLFLHLLVKTIRRMMAISMKRNWKSPRLLRI